MDLNNTSALIIPEEQSEGDSSSVRNPLDKLILLIKVIALNFS